MTSSISVKIDPDINLGELRFLREHIIKTLSLPDFIEEESGANLQWVSPDCSAKCCCPLHDENEPSFHVNLIEETWLYHCFGCGAKGTIIHFCQDFHGLRNQLEAIYYLCQKYNIQNTSDLILEGIKKVGVKVDQQRLLENANILVSNQCRILLRKNYDLHSKWVASAYKRLNEAMTQGKKKEVDKISYEASNRMQLRSKNE
jgi:DNA primase